MQLLAVLVAAVAVNAVIVVQPVVQELEKKSPHRHGRWWRWRHGNHDNGHGHGHGHGHGNGGHGDHGHNTDGGEAITEVFTYDDPMSSSTATSTIVDPGTFTSIAYTFTTDETLPSTSAITSSSATSSYIYPNTTSAPLTTTLPPSSSIMTSYTYPNTTHTYSYPNASSPLPSNSSPSVPSTTSFIPGCSITPLTSTLTITESVTTTFTYTPTNAPSYTWVTSMASSSTSQSAAPFPNITYSFNASQIFNFTTFKASPYYPSTILSTMIVSTTSSLPSSPSSSSSSTIETSPSSTPLLPTSLLISASPIFIAPTTAVLHPSTTVSQTTTVIEGEATGVPDPTAFHCGVHGLPIGLYKMAEYWEERAGVDVSLEGCWEFCEAASEGCFSYSFYQEEGLGDARCDLFGGSVADSLDSIIKEVPRVWYDIGCGNPLLLK
ncbi:hypothetical protein BKA65DRAFT_571761 [Rhexocercosporidium sp. MPI-PUGE-AT-0058]|nr:hypothetical protein BKA65DRAFT_571761 [Rhexocercosporidium sp. MPI-PUGE-AT-0058]